MTGYSQYPSLDKMINNTTEGKMERIEVTRSERNEVENARDAMHRAVIDILKARGFDYMAADLSEVAELIALEGYFNADEVEYIVNGGEVREV